MLYEVITPKPNNTPARIHAPKLGAIETLVAVSIQRIKKKISTEIAARKIQWYVLRPSFPAVFNREGKVPAINPINNQINCAA